MCIHEKLSHISSYFVKSVPCICSQRVKVLLLPGQNSHDQMSMQSETNGALNNDCKKYPNDESVHSSRKENHNKERLRRPDKPLYVPRALRGVQHEKEKEDSSATKNNLADVFVRKTETHSLTGQFSEDGSFENISKPDASDESLKDKISEIYIDNIEEQEVCNDKLVNFSQMTDVNTHDDTTCVGKTENSQMSLKHKICSETEDETQFERIKFFNIENENLPIEFPVKLKSRLKSQEASVNNLELKEKGSERSDINRRTKSSKSKLGGKSRSHFMNKHSVKENDVFPMSSNKQEEKENSCMLECKNNQESAMCSIVESLIETNNACSSKCNENSNPQFEDNGQIVSKDKSIVNKSESFERTHFQDEKSADSWETMFNEDGDCLEPNTLKELCEIAESNHLKVTKITTDYESFADTKSRENENIVELFNFPVEFTTQDLISALSLFQKDNYTIKWVDDCHALAVFTSPALANQALIMQHPFVKIRALSEATKESKTKAKQCAKLHESSKPRPVTSATLARRLVSGALGIKNYVSKEQQDVERKLLSEARGSGSF